MIIYLFREATTLQMMGLAGQQSGFELILLTHMNPLVALFSSVVVFLVVAYAESSRRAPTHSHGRCVVTRGKYPIRLVYASNIPVILMAALLANINMFTLLFWSHPVLSKTPVLGREGVLSASEYLGSPGSDHRRPQVDSHGIPAW